MRWLSPKKNETFRLFQCFFWALSVWCPRLIEEFEMYRRRLFQESIGEVFYTSVNAVEDEINAMQSSVILHVYEPFKKSPESLSSNTSQSLTEWFGFVSIYSIWHKIKYCTDLVYKWICVSSYICSVSYIWDNKSKAYGFWVIIWTHQKCRPHKSKTLLSPFHF